MYDVTQEFINYSQQNGRQINLRITWGSQVFESDEIYSFSKDFDGDFYRSVMQYVECEIEGRHDLTDAVVQIELGVSANDMPYEYVDYGLFIVKEHERIVGAYGSPDKTSFKAYDVMLNAHTLYDVADLGITYPITVLALLQAIAGHIGSEFQQTELVNGDKVITEDKWTNIENITYRNILDEISAVSGSSIMVKKNKLVAKMVDVNTLDKGYINEDIIKSLSIKDILKPVNILNLTREQQHDNYVYPINWESIPINDRSEIVIPDNQIMDKNRADYAPDLFNAIEGLSYYPFVADSFGTLHLMPLDVVEVVDLNGVSHTSVVTSLSITVTSGIKEELRSEIPTYTKEKYALVTDNKREFMRVYFLVDQQNGVIEGAIQQVDDTNDRLAQLRITVDEIEQTVSNIDTTNNIIPNFNGYSIYKGWSWLGGDLKAVEGLTAVEGLRQSTNWIRRSVDSEAVYGLEFFSGGNTFSPKGLVTGGEEYSYNTRVMHGTENYQITIREYTEFEGAPTETQTFTIDVSQDRPNFTFTVGASARYVDLKYTIPPTVTPTNTVLVTEQVFNKGQPGEFSFSVSEFVNQTESKITQLSDEVTTSVMRVDTLDGIVSEHSTQIIQNADNILLKVNKSGIIGGINASAETVKILSDRLDFNNATGVNVDLSGKITATSGTFTNVNISGNLNAGKVGNLNINASGITFPNGKLKLDSANNAIKAGNTSMTFNGEYTSDAFQFGADTFIFGNGTIGVNKITNGGGGNAVVEINTGIIELRGSARVEAYSWTTKLKSTGSITLESPENTIMGDLHTTSMYPRHDLCSIGSSTKRYNYIFLRNQPNVSSDISLKKNIQDIPKELISELVSVKPRMYQLKDSEEWHFGYIAQDVEKAINEYLSKNKDNKDFAMLNNKDELLSLLYGEIAVIKEAQLQSQIDELRRIIWNKKIK